MSKITLGKKLKELRELSGFTLRQVEEIELISNAYLSQLENDKIKKPSANVLYKLATLYNVDMDVLLHAAGLIEQKPSIPNKLLNTIALAAQKITTEEEAALLDYLKYLRHKKRQLG